MNYCQYRNDVIKRLCNSGGGLLPSEYQQVDYIESKYNNGSNSTTGDNKQYITTGVNYFADFEIESQITDVSHGGKICGVATSNCLQRVSASNPVFSCWNSDSSYYATAANIYTRHKIKWANNSVYVDDVYVTNFTKASYNAPFILMGTGAVAASGYYTSWAHIRIYSAKLWDTNGDLIRDFIPCYRKSDSKPGMYDLVTNTFFTNAGTGEFAVGNPV